MGLSLRSAFSQDGHAANVVFILADDLGWHDTTLYGSTFLETPNVHRLAQRGMMFASAYAANPLCSPTRASSMTGLHPARIGITSPACHLKEERLEATVQEKAPPNREALLCQSATRLSQEYTTLAEALKDAGHRTGHFGKWHLGHEPYDPLHQGFDVDIPHTPAPGPSGGYLGPREFWTADGGQMGSTSRTGWPRKRPGSCARTATGHSSPTTGASRSTRRIRRRRS